MINIVPEDSLQPYDMKEIIQSVLDNNKFFHSRIVCTNIVVGYGRLNGRTVGIVVKSTYIIGETLDIDSSNKAARFIRFCDCYNIPIITFVDTPGYMPGTNQEHNGIIRHGSKFYTHIVKQLFQE